MNGGCQVENRQVSPKRKAAFETILDFKRPNTTVINFHNIFPHLMNPHHPNHRVRRSLLRRFRSFNKDHMAAFQGLKQKGNTLILPPRLRS
ncbi:hypothetical protein QL093DRAFT_1322152 [Fusarium oxysporum]|nr:hypothetical protein QL093DRAFT_1322152 [Fusarium oxysporum]